MDDNMSEELRNNYLDAQSNLATAPIQLEQAKEAYYVYSQGRNAYNTLKMGELNDAISEIANKRQLKFLKNIDSALLMNDYYKSDLIQINKIEELYNSYVDKNKRAKLKIKQNYGDILTNDRKTYYETDALNQLNTWHFFWIIIYYVLFIVLVLSIWLVRTNKYNKTLFAALSTIFIVAGYPIYINYIIQFIIMIGDKIYNMIPVNIYNNL